MFDASGSIHTHDFGALKNMIQQVTSQFVISSTGNIYIPLTNRVRGPYCNLRTEFFPL